MRKVLYIVFYSLNIIGFKKVPGERVYFMFTKCFSI